MGNHLKSVMGTDGDVVGGGMKHFLSSSDRSENLLLHVSEIVTNVYMAISGTNS